MALRVKTTSTRFPMVNTSLNSIPSVYHPWGERCGPVYSAERMNVVVVVV